jgi:glycogen debranching enzyme
MELHMEPGPGARRRLHVGDRLRVELTVPGAGDGWRAVLRTDLGAEAPRPDEPAWAAQARWHDLPMIDLGGGRYAAEALCTRPGWFSAKASAIAPDGSRHWPAGVDIGIAVHPDCWRSANSIYCAFPRMFGSSRTQRSTRDPLRDEMHAVYDRQGWTVIPPSGTFRDLAAQVPFITERLGCRIVHLLPVHPVPTTHARYGRYGSPYAATDLTAVDPALAVHDRRSTPLEQFGELVRSIHAHDARVIIDLAINHTGWASILQQEHPEWFRRDADGTFHSPGAWGVVWEDLAELDHRHPALWDHLAQIFLTWCRRGVDGFRCDAGYMVPLPAWQRIVNAVRREFPDTLFLLEGLGGGWDATASLMTAGGLGWAYSELFQNFEPQHIHGYLDHSDQASSELGLLVHYSETHDNDRLAKRGVAWSLMRNRLSALASHQGAWGWTCGVEWLADEKLEVHQSRGLNWGAEPNLVDELAQLTRLTCDHPAFWDAATVRRHSRGDEPLVLMERRGADGVLLLCGVNTDLTAARAIRIPGSLSRELGGEPVDLLPCGGRLRTGADWWLELPAGAACAWAARRHDGQAGGRAYRAARARAAAAAGWLAQVLPLAALGPADWRALAVLVERDAASMLGALHRVDAAAAARDLPTALSAALADGGYPTVVHWSPADATRVVDIPPDHWLLLRCPRPFRADVVHAGGRTRLISVPVAGGQVAALRLPQPGPAELVIEADGLGEPGVRGRLHALSGRWEPPALTTADTVAVLTNGRGAMSRWCLDLGRVRSKYDAVLAANLHPTLPVDRHVLVKRVRLWSDADGFNMALDGRAVVAVEADPSGVRWRLRAGAGNGRLVDVVAQARMVPGRNRVELRLRRIGGGVSLPLRLVVRVDHEDRSFHAETSGTPEAEQAFRAALGNVGAEGYALAHAADRGVRVRLHGGQFHVGEEWSRDIPHPVEAQRGMRDRGDAWSPGWFSADLGDSAEAVLVLDADGDAAAPSEAWHPPQPASAPVSAFLAALDACVVGRDDGQTIIAGYPWFLDWGRDTLIAGRGLLAAGRDAVVDGLLRIFGRFEEGGTLPNIIHGATIGNRDTVDAPLWYGVLAGEWSERHGRAALDVPVTPGGRSIARVLTDIVRGYRAGTANGISVDAGSGLVFAPPHFTWMDTNYPAATPREGYPVEIQALWLRLLALGRDAGLEEPGVPWAELHAQAQASFLRLFTGADGRLLDHLEARPGTPAHQARAHNALRCNSLLAVSLGVVTGPVAQATVLAAARHLVVPGALRSLAPLAVDPPLEIRSADGRLLGDPLRPYRGRYQGDEDGSRKPAYHNGTAWGWFLPVFAEALVQAWPDDQHARAAARAYLIGLDRVLHQGAVGHLAEICDGDAPHQERGCDAQAWSASEPLRVLRRIGG